MPGPPLNRSDAAAYAAFITATYSMFMADESVLNPDPTGHGVPSGWNVVAWITMKDFLLGDIERFYGIVAENEPGWHVVAIRGTGSNVLAEWLEDIDCIAVPFTPVPAAGHVAQGFDRVYGSMKVYPRETLATREPMVATKVAPGKSLSGSFGEQMTQLLQMRSERRKAMIAEVLPAEEPMHIVTGHSLGAALCTLYVMENMYAERLKKPLICTFASPRVGNATFAQLFDNLSELTSWRIVNKPDIVPKLPPDIWGWVHVSDEYEFDSSDTVRRTLACAHALQTYISLLTPMVKPDPECIPG